MLLPHHLEDLKRSGLADDTIAAAGIFSESNHTKLAALLNRKAYSRKNGAAMVFPFHDETGAVVLYRVKPDNAPTNGNGKKAKYLSPTGAAVRAYVPQSVNGDMADAERVLLITEGEKKSLKAVQDGFLCVGLCGVDCWHNRKSSALIADLARIAWKGRRVFVVFDSDAADNGNVRENENLLGAVLANHGATVRVVRLPPGPDGKKVGLDDYLVAHDAAALWQLLNKAEEPQPPDPDTMKMPATLLDPATEAAALLAANTEDGMPRLRFWRGAFYWWFRGAYRHKHADQVRGELIQHLNRHTMRLTNSVVANVVDQLRAQAMLPYETDAPAWLADVKPWPATEVLVAKNGIFHLLSTLAGESYCVPLTPKLFSLAALDYDVTMDAPRPDKWLQFLAELWPDDPQNIDTLQEWFGYLLTADASQQKILFLVGPKRAGKGVIARIVRAMIGPENVAAPTLAMLGTNFGLWPLIGKSVAVIPDARLSGRSDRAIVIERLLSISGEDALTIDRKNLEPVTVKLPTRLMLISNELPRLTDASAAGIGCNSAAGSSSLTPAPSWLPRCWSWPAP